MSTFLVPIDDQDTGKESLTLGRMMASALGAELRLVYTSCRCKRDDDTVAKAFVTSAGPDEALLRWIKTLEQPVIVLETQARSSDGQLVSDWITSHAGPSVTSLAGAATDNGPITRLLVPLDGSAGAEQILELATTIARKTGATVGLVQVVEDDAGDEERRSQLQVERHEARNYLEQTARRLRGQDVHVTWEVRIGSAGYEIARAAETTAASLILIASQHYGQSQTADSPSVAGDTSSSSNVPTIVARIHPTSYPDIPPVSTPSSL